MRSSSARIVLGVGAAVVGLLLAPSFGCMADAQATATPAPAPATFAAVSVRPFQPGAGPPPGGEWIRSNPAGVRIYDRTVQQIICYAYGIDAFQLKGGPAWLHAGAGDWYNIDATTSVPATNAQMRAMLRTALAERFGLKLTRTMTPRPVLSLVVAKGGPKLRKLAPGETVQWVSMKPGSVTFRFATIQDFVNFYDDGGIERVLGRPLVDNTGLKGRYNVELTYSRTPRSDGRRGSRFGVEAMPKVVERLGLELDRVTMPMPIYTVVSVHRPSPN